MSGFRMRAGGASFSQRKVLAEAIVPLLSPTASKLAGGHLIRDSINLANTVASHW